MSVHDPPAPPRLVPEGIRPTKVGMWFVVFALVVGLAGTNTGNNGLYMVLALMLSTLGVSGLLSRNNVRALRVVLAPPGELFAETPAAFEVTIENLGRRLPRWMLVLSLGTEISSTALFPYVPARGRRSATLQITPPRRGRYKISTAHLGTLFPLGFFRKGSRQTIARELLVFPRLAKGDQVTIETSAQLGPRPSRRPGLGHDLHSLRLLRPGDDPRRIHWKQTARTGEMIYMEREAEQQRRVSIVLDNALDLSDGSRAHDLLEERISEAASAAVEYLKMGFEVELVSRTAQVPFGGGRRQRRVLLEALALLEAAAPTARPLEAAAGREIRFEA